VQYGIDQLERCLVLVWLPPRRNARSIVYHLDTAITIQRHRDVVARASQGLIDGIIDHLVDQVVQCLDTGATHVHAGPTPDRFQPFQNLDLLRTILTLAHPYHLSHLPPRQRAVHRRLPCPQYFHSAITLVTFIFINTKARFV